ncbi:MAG: hypothetical protein QOF69_1546, partial [Solirubrobacteraceae bacterium]|nr:hypothetical protein [Solirubrobacteraceae bacterium]
MCICSPTWSRRSGIAPLWPFSQNGVSLGLRTGDHRETLVVLAVALVTLALAAGELYGRALVVFAAQHCASQLVLPTAKRRGSVLPGSHKDIARKAFERITK